MCLAYSSASLSLLHLQNEIHSISGAPVGYVLQARMIYRGVLLLGLHVVQPVLTNEALVTESYLCDMSDGKELPLLNSKHTS